MGKPRPTCSQSRFPVSRLEGILEGPQKGHYLIPAEGFLDRARGSRDFSVYRGLSAGLGVFLSFGCRHPVAYVSFPDAIRERYDFRSGHRFVIAARLLGSPYALRHEGYPEGHGPRSYLAERLLRARVSLQRLGRFIRT